MLSVAFMLGLAAIPTLAEPLQSENRPETQSAEAGRAERHPTPTALSEIAAWLSSHFALPATAELPHIAFASPAKMAAIRHRGLSAGLQARVVNDEQWVERMRDVMALYEDASRTIYLREDWTGATPAEMSVLVHEMVHHLQNLATEKFQCPQARERTAYEAQQKWLEDAGADFFKEFEVDPMTLMLRTSCMG
jgi:hypothetical protein